MFVVDDEVKLVQRCLNSEDAGIRAFVEQFQSMIFGLCFRVLGHRQDAEDVTQDVFIRVFRSLHRWDQKRPLKPWLLTIAVNRCRTALEKRIRRPAQSELAVDLTSTEPNFETADLAEEIQLGLEKLRDDYRNCFVLFYHQELSLAEISEILDCPQGTIKTWLHRARHELSEHLQRRGVEPNA